MTLLHATHFCIQRKSFGVGWTSALACPKSRRTSTMTSIDETIIEKIQKLLALSTSSNEHEAALALAKAQNMLLQYNLSLEEVSAKQKPDRHYTKDTITASR